MKVTVYDVAEPDRKVDGKYTIDTTFGVPAIGDEIYLRDRAYDRLDKHYLAGTVRKRQWFLADDDLARSELRLWVQQHGN